MKKLVIYIFFIFLASLLSPLLAQNGMLYDFEPTLEIEGDSEKEELTLNPIFIGYYEKLSLIEHELTSFKVNKQFYTIAAGDINKLFKLYVSYMSDIKRDILNEDLSLLTPLDKFTLSVYIDYLKVEVIYRNFYYTADDKKDKLNYLRSKINEIIEYEDIPKNYPYQRTVYFKEDEGGLRKFEDRVKSLLYAIYSENIFWALREGLGSTDFEHQIEDYAFRALRLNPNNERAHNNLAIFYIRKADVNPLDGMGYLGLAKEHLDRVFEINDLRIENNKAINEVRVFYAFLWNSQIAVNQLDYTYAYEQIEIAKELFPANGYLKLATFLLKYNHSFFRDSEILLSADRDSHLFVNYYNRNEVMFTPLKISHSFNFILDRVIFSPYLVYGFNQGVAEPMSFYFEEGIRYRFSIYQLKLAAIQKPLLDFKLGEYVANMNFGGYFKRVDFSFDFYYGFMWEDLYQESTDQFEYQPATAISEKFLIDFVLYRSIYHRVSLGLEANHQYDIDLKIHGYSSFLKLPLNLFYNSWVLWKSQFKLGYADSTDSSQVRNELGVFHEQPLPVSRVNSLSQSGMSGNWLVQFYTMYQFFPFTNAKLITWTKGIYLAPSFHVGGVSDNFSQVKDSVWTYSMMGNIGVRFAGGEQMSFGLGWNSNEGFAINLFFY